MNLNLRASLSWQRSLPCFSLLHCVSQLPPDFNGYALLFDIVASYIQSSSAEFSYQCIERVMVAYIFLVGYLSPDYLLASGPKYQTDPQLALCFVLLTLQ